MELWTDYEGITIDGAFPLKKLLLSEGRSAFFSTSNGKGDLTLIRLIACHFDEEEILARWRGVESLSHPGFLKLERYGQLLLDDVTVVYAVFERAEANLSQVVNERRMTTAETTQLAASLSSALQTLHSNGFVHEHVSPSNVFAVGDLVKLRTDCIREAPEGEKGLEAKRRDVYDLAMVLLEALTQERTVDSSSRAVASLPAPFDQIVTKGISGAWGTAEITSALEAARPSARTSARTVAPTTRPPIPPAANPAPAVNPTISYRATSSVATPVPTPRASGSGVPPRSFQTAGYRVPLQDRFLAMTPRSKWVGATALAVFVLILALGFAGRTARPGSTNGAAQASSAVAVTPGHAAPRNSAEPVQPSASKPSAYALRNHTATTAQEQWRVIAYTYNHEDQAQQKSAVVAQKHPGLHPEVYTPNGRAPYLVTVGGVMGKDQAFAFARKSRLLGLPGDTYAQNYTNASR